MLSNRNRTRLGVERLDSRLVPSSTTWTYTGAGYGNAATSGNWSNGVPDSDDDVTIPGSTGDIEWTSATHIQSLNIASGWGGNFLAGDDFEVGSTSPPPPLSPPIPASAVLSGTIEVDGDFTFNGEDATLELGGTDLTADKLVLPGNFTLGANVYADGMHVLAQYGSGEITGNLSVTGGGTFTFDDEGAVTTVNDNYTLNANVLVGYSQKAEFKIPNSKDVIMTGYLRAGEGPVAWGGTSSYGRVTLGRYAILEVTGTHTYSVEGADAEANVWLARNNSMWLDSTKATLFMGAGSTLAADVVHVPGGRIHLAHENGYDARAYITGELTIDRENDNGDNTHGSIVFTSSRSGDSDFTSAESGSVLDLLGHTFHINNGDIYVVVNRSSYNGQSCSAVLCTTLDNAGGTNHVYTTTDYSSTYYASNGSQLCYLFTEDAYFGTGFADVDGNYSLNSGYTGNPNQRFYLSHASGA